MGAQTESSCWATGQKQARIATHPHIYKIAKNMVYILS